MGMHKHAYRALSADNSWVWNDDEKKIMSETSSIETINTVVDYLNVHKRSLLLSYRNNHLLIIIRSEEHKLALW